MMKRYVSGDRTGRLQSNRGDTARTILSDRQASFSWFGQHYPIIYELVPVSAEELKPKKRVAAEQEEPNR